MLRNLEQRLELINRLSQPVRPSKETGDLHHIPALQDRGNFQDIWNHELCGSVFGVLL